MDPDPGLQGVFGYFHEHHYEASIREKNSKEVST